MEHWGWGLSHSQAGQGPASTPAGPRGSWQDRGLQAGGETTDTDFSTWSLGVRDRSAESS